ncbi:hypothetical protein YC2023_075940 [Brassica napus]
MYFSSESSLWCFPAEVSEWALLLGACKFRPDLGACRSGEVGGGACCFSTVLRDVSYMACSSPLFVAHPLCVSSGLGDPCLLLEWFVAQNHCRIRVSCSRLFKFCPFASSRVQAGLCLWFSEHDHVEFLSYPVSRG